MKTEHQFEQGNPQFKVTVSADEVAKFNKRWPGSPVVEQEYIFTLDRRLDCEVADVNPSLPNGLAAATLMDMAQEHGKGFVALWKPQNKA